MTPAQIKAAAREYALRSRKEQGLPQAFNDPDAMQKIAVLLGMREVSDDTD